MKKMILALGQAILWAQTYEIRLVQSNSWKTFRME
jgi:hypothetical protein